LSENTSKNNKNFIYLVLLSLLVVGVGFFINHLQGSRNVLLRGVLQEELRPSSNELILEGSFESKCFLYDYASNVNVVNANYFYHVDGNDVLSLYQNVEGHCQLIKTVDVDGFVQRAKELNGYLVVSTQHSLYMINSSSQHHFGPYPLVSDFNMVDDTLIFASDFNQETRENTLVFIDSNFNESSRIMTGNNAQIDTILVNDANVIISFTSDFLASNIVNFYSARLYDLLDNIARNSPNYTKMKNYVDEDAQSSFININRLPYFGNKQLQCQEDLTSCVYFENTVLAYNHDFSVVKFNDQAVLVNNRDKSYIPLGPLTWSYDLSNDHVYVIDGPRVRVYGLM